MVSYFNMFRRMTVEEAYAFSKTETMVDDIGCSPLIAAIDLENLVLIEKFLKRGLSPLYHTDRSPYGASLSVRDQRFRLIIFKLLAFYTESFADNCFYQLPDLVEPLIHEVIRIEEVELVSLMLDKGASLDEIVSNTIKTVFLDRVRTVSI